jgi:hypothetical protein
LKNAYYIRTNGQVANVAEWNLHFTTGRHGRASWPKIADYLKLHGYQGVICLFAEYSDEEHSDKYIADDIAFAKSLFV